MGNAIDGPVRPEQRIGPRELAPLLSGWRDTAPGVPGYRALAERIRLLVLDGRLPVDVVLPSERALADVLQTSRTTTTAAYRLLRDEGFAHGSHGAGTWTALPANDAPVSAWPMAMDSRVPTADGRGDLASAASAAPPEVHAAYATALAELPRWLPGHGYVTAGLPVLRSQIAGLYDRRGLPTAPEEVMVTSGALHGLHLVLARLVQPGERVLVEHPTYPIFLDAIRRVGARPVPMPIEDGWDAAAARRVLRQTNARFALLIPDFHNPTGQLLGSAGREALASSLADAGCVTIVDETTQALDLRAALGRSAPDVPPFAAVTRPGAAITLGSTSKSVWGGLRVGWVRAERSLIRQLASARAADDLAGPVLEQLAAAHLLEQLDPLVDRLRADLARNCRALRAALAVHLPAWEAPEPDGGMVLWCRLPQPRSSELVAAARSVGILLAAGPRFGVDGAFESRLRVPFARPAEHLTAAAALLAQAWHSPGGTAEVHVDADVV